MNRHLRPLDLAFVIAVFIPLAAVTASSCYSAALIAVAMTGGRLP